MPVGDLGDYDVEPVSGNPFGAMADSPDNYDVQEVDHDPFAGENAGAPDQFQLAARNLGPSRPYTPTPSADMPPMDADDRDKLIKTVAAEAGNQPPIGQAAVAHTIFNRLRSGQYGQNVSDVVTEPVKPGSAYRQFSVWNPPGLRESSKIARNLDPRSPQYAAIGNVVDRVHSGVIPDPTGGAFHYYAPRAMAGGKPPPWAGPLADLNDVTIGDQRFVGRPIQPPHTPTPSFSRVAGGYADGGGVTDLGDYDDDDPGRKQGLGGISDPDYITRTATENISGPGQPEALSSAAPAPASAPGEVLRGGVSPQSSFGGGDDPERDAAVQSYTRASAEDAGRSGLKGIFAPPADLAAQLNAVGAAAPPYHELDPAQGGAERFHAAIAAAKAANPAGAAVTLYSPDDYRDARTFVTPDDRAGFALKGDDIVSVFKHPDATNAPKITRSMLSLATSEGGRRLDAFDTVLPQLYGQSGFRAVARLPWNEEYKPEGWNHADFARFNGGRPDVVFMVHDPAYGKAYQSGDGPMVADYDAGVAAQNDALRQQRGISGVMTPPQLVGRPSTGLVGEEEHLQRLREGLDVPRTEWTGGRVAYADGGALQRHLALLRRPRYNPSSSRVSATSAAITSSQSSRPYIAT